MASSAPRFTVPTTRLQGVGTQRPSFRTRAASAGGGGPVPGPAGFPSRLDVGCFTLIVDDLVFPDGRTLMAQLGGGGPQTIFGARLHPADLAAGLAAEVRGLGLGFRVWGLGFVV